MRKTRNLQTTAKTLAKKLSRISRVWNGKSAILEMKNDGSSHWKQMEWIGFYFEYLCNKVLARASDIPGPRYGRTGFDSFNAIPWDFKAHAINTSAHTIIVNDTEAILKAIRQYGSVGVILALGEVEYNDRKRTFQKWHSKLKGGISAYEKSRIERGAWSRLRKTSFNLKQILFLVLTKESLQKTGSFQSSFRNSNGRPRRKKVLVDLEMLQKEVVYKIEF